MNALDNISNATGRVGVDIGSRATKVVTMNNSEICFNIMDTPDFLKGSRDFLIPDGTDIVTTGYGRHNIKGSRSIPEIRAHTTGVIRSLDLDDFTILDIGGQDFKVIRVQGRSIRDFNMNDKCAAGTGRFLEKMASMLSMGLNELGEHRGSRKMLESTCSVFTETEIISLMMNGVAIDDLASGVVRSVYDRVRPYLRMYPSDVVIFTGGVSSMSGLVGTISKDLGVEVIVPENAQFMGAFGCFYSQSANKH